MISLWSPFRHKTVLNGLPMDSSWLPEGVVIDCCDDVTSSFLWLLIFLVTGIYKNIDLLMVSLGFL